MALPACEGCGAALSVPTDSSVATFVCEFCKREYRTADFGNAASRLEAGLGKAIDEHARAQRRLILIVAGALAALIAVVAVLAASKGEPPAPGAPAPPSRPAVAAAPVPSPATPAPAAPAAPSIAKLEFTFGGEGTGAGRFDRAHN